ncbi:MAG: LamG-like jellyroll fold domain-containing protein, partial [Pseudomonadota bacterium]
RTRTVSIDLESGAHDIEVRYFENGGNQTLQLAWTGPDTGGVKEVIGGDSFEYGYTLENLAIDEDAPGAVVAQLNVADPDAGDTHEFSVNDDRFEVVEQDGAYVVKLKDDAAIDHESESNVDVTVTVTDAGGASDAITLPVEIKNTNDAPEIVLSGGEGLKASYFDIGHALRNLSEIDFDATPDAEGVVDSLNYMQGREAFWEGAPADFFAAKYEGQIIVEEGGSYTFSMASDDGSMLFINGEPVLDNDGLHGTRTRTVSIDLESGAHDIEVRYFENGGNQTLQLAWTGPDTGGVKEVIGGDSYRLPGFDETSLLGVSENTAGDHAALLSIVDPQGDAFDITVSDDRFEVVEASEGYALKLKDGAAVDHETESEINVTVTTTDSHGESSSESFTVPVADLNEAPTQVTLSNASITENEDGAVVGTLTAVDPDSGDAITFAASDDRFEIVDGQLKLKNGVSVDHEAESEISVTVTATDEGGLSTTETFSIDVADVNEAPVDFAIDPIASESGVLSLNQDGGTDDAAIASNLEGFPTDALTVEVRFSSDQSDVGNGTPLFSYAANDGSNNEALIWLEGSSGNMTIYLAGQRIDTGISNALLLDGEEHQVSFSWDQSSNELKVYVDGEPAFDRSINIRDLKSDGTMALGQEQDAEGGRFDSRQIFEGEIAEVRIFDYARSDSEIADNAVSPFGDPETEPGLVNNWVMDAETGGVVEDLAGGNDLVLSNDASIEGGEAFETPTVIENQPGAVAGVLSATDPQTGGAVSEFVIADDPSGLFEVVGNELKLKDGVSLNHEEQQSYDVTVEAIGAGGESTQQVVSVSVADVEEAPVDFRFDPAMSQSALSLNQDGGTDDAAIAANLEGFPTDALTVEVRFASDQTDVGNGTPLFSYAASDGSNNEALIWLEGSSGNMTIFLAGQKINTGVPNASLLDGEEHQVSFSWDQASNEVKVFVDGEPVFDTTVNIRDLKTDGTMALGQEQDAEGGRFDSGQIFEGEISEVRIFDYARSDAEIADNASSPFGDPETEPGLVNNWVMDAESGGVVEDLAGGNDLVLQNGAAIGQSELAGPPMVAENEAGAMVGSFSATDPNTGEAITQFEIVDDASGLFEVVGNALKLKEGASLDFETQPQLDVTVHAVSPDGEATPMTVTVNVADVDETNLIEGTDGNDRLSGTDGEDLILGGAGNDVIRGGEGADSLFGGDGNDRIFAGSEDTIIDGGDGVDRVIAQDNNDFSIDMAASNVERVDGKGGNDVIDGSGATERVVQIGRGGDDTLTGGAGNDVQRGGAGDDIIMGGAGRDNIRGDAGADQLFGGDGNDVIYADSDDTFIDGGDGVDRVIVQNNDDFSIDMAASNVERVDGKGGNDVIDGSGAKERVVQIGRGGDDTLTGGSGNDVQRGGAGDDVIMGGAGRDNIRGDAGADELFGGDDNDVIRGGGGDDLISGGDGNDNLNGNAGDDSITGGAGDDVMRGGDGSDVFVYAMGDGNDRILGGAGDGWTDVIQLEGGAAALGEFGTDWTVSLTEGSIVSSDENGIVFS